MMGRRAERGFGSVDVQTDPRCVEEGSDEIVLGVDLGEPNPARQERLM
jgi:hypothetical protein